LFIKNFWAAGPAMRCKFPFKNLCLQRYKIASVGRGFVAAGNGFFLVSFSLLSGLGGGGWRRMTLARV